MTWGYFGHYISSLFTPASPSSSDLLRSFLTHVRRLQSIRSLFFVKKKNQQMRKRTVYAWAVALVCFIVLMIVTPAIPQSQEYHDFADKRKFFGKPLSYD